MSSLSKKIDVNYQRIWELIPFAGALMLVAALMYIRGHLDGSGLPPSEWASHIAQAGPYWPLHLSFLGWAILGCWLIVEVLIDE